MVTDLNEGKGPGISLFNSLSLSPTFMLALLKSATRLPKCGRQLSTPSRPRISFASDNTSGVHPKIMKAIEKANVGHVTGYGEDEITMRAKSTFGKEFGIPESQIHFVPNGTGANVLAFGSVSTWFSSVLVSESSHVNVDEGGAPERVFGIKVVPLRRQSAVEASLKEKLTKEVTGLSVDAQENGFWEDSSKISVKQILEHTHRFGDVHHSQPRLVSITQPTEFGTLYEKEEILEISRVCKAHGLLLHMDGARISNAAAAQGMGLRESTRDLGVDLMSFGGTKNGLLLGEAVLFFSPGLGSNFRHLQKQCMLMPSKTRFIAAQMEALITDKLWLENASQANSMTRSLLQVLLKFPRIHITHKCQANAIFATMPREYIDFLLEDFYFYVWDETSLLVRLMCSFNTEPQHIQAFEKRLSEAQQIFG